MINDLLANFVVSSERSEGSSNKNVLALSSISLGKFNSLSRAYVKLLEVSLDISVALFEVLKSLGNVFFEFSDLDLYKLNFSLSTYVVLLNDLASVEHFCVLNEPIK